MRKGVLSLETIGLDTFRAEWGPGWDTGFPRLDTRDPVFGTEHCPHRAATPYAILVDTLWLAENSSDTISVLAVDIFSEEHMSTRYTPVGGSSSNTQSKFCVGNDRIYCQQKMFSI